MVKAIVLSLFTIPSAPFWLIFLSYDIVTVNSLVSTLFDMPENIYLIPGITDIISCQMYRQKFFFQLILAAISLFLINSYVIKYYLKSHRSSSEDIKRKLYIFLTCYVIFSILYLIFSFFSIYFDFSVHPHLQTLFFFLFLLMQPCIHIIPKSIIRLKHNKRKLPGTFFAFMEIILIIALIPIILILAIFHFQIPLLLSIYRLITTICYIINIMMFIMDGITFLSKRFIRYHEFVQLTEQKRPKKKTIPV